MSIIDEGYFVFFVKKIIVRVLRLFAEIERKKKEMKNLIMFFVFEIGEQRVLPRLTFFFWDLYYVEYWDLMFFGIFRRGIDEAGTGFFYKNMRGRTIHSEAWWLMG